LGTQIKTWQISGGKLEPLDTSLKEQGRTEPGDLEPWLASYPVILGSDVVIIGRQVATRSGPIDLLGIDRSGNLVIIEIKRDLLPREALAQAIDYASDVATWSIDRLGEVCLKYSQKTLEDVLGEAFPDLEVEGLNINETQRIMLVGFSIESPLERMIEWLSNNFNVNINAIVLRYIKTTRGDELLVRTSIIPEELEQERVQQQKKFIIPMSDEPGQYDHATLRERLADYLSKDRITIVASEGLSSRRS
jgi:hypothetical protein